MSEKNLYVIVENCFNEDYGRGHWEYDDDNILITWGTRDDIKERVDRLNKKRFDSIITNLEEEVTRWNGRIDEHKENLNQFKDPNNSPLAEHYVRSIDNCKIYIKEAMERREFLLGIKDYTSYLCTKYLDYYEYELLDGYFDVDFEVKDGKIIHNDE